MAKLGTRFLSDNGGDALTPQELRQWRAQLGWSLTRAAAELGVNRRTYLYYEQGKTSAGNQIEDIPLVVELATITLTRRARKRARAAQKESEAAALTADC